jgi:hypothetical protein
MCPWCAAPTKNANLLLRQYFPPGTDLSVYSQAQRDRVALRLNQRPRKALGFPTPASKTPSKCCVDPLNRPELSALSRRPQAQGLTQLNLSDGNHLPMRRTKRAIVGSIYWWCGVFLTNERFSEGSGAVRQPHFQEMLDI